MNNLLDYRKFGSFCIDQGKQFLNKATPMKTTVWGASTITDTIRNLTGLVGGQVYSADEKHYTTDIDTWKIIIENDWTNKKTWLTDKFDCDNFAGSFSNYCADIYLLNSAGRITVKLLDPISGKLIGYHRAVIIVDDKLNCWLLESQSDKMIQIEKGKSLVIDKWEYIPVSVDLN